MSNRANAARYNGDSSVRGGGGGGVDLFGIRTAHQKDLMTLQQAQELERIKAQAAADKDVDTNSGKVKDTSATLAVGLKAAQDAGLVPANMSVDIIPQDLKDQINELGRTHLALQQKTQDSPEFQKSFMSGAASVQAKPTFDNNETAARARALSTTVLQPNTADIIGMPNGIPGEPPQYASGPVQKISTVGGITDPKTGQLIGARPVETYGQASFPPVGKISLGTSQNLTNNLGTKPDVANSQPDLASTFGMNFAQQPQDNAQPAAGNTPPVLTKPPENGPGMIDYNSPGPAMIINLLKYLQSTNNPGMQRGIGATPTTF